MKKNPQLNESFISRIWERLDEFCNELYTDKGLRLEIINRGTPNFDSGPDFKNAVIKINNKLYNGDIEIHRDYACWNQHKHHKDQKYNSVILQVVMWNKGNDLPKLKMNREAFTVILSEHLKMSIYEIWQKLISEKPEKQVFKCKELSEHIDDNILYEMIDKCGYERLEMKSERFRDRLNEIIKFTEREEKDPEVWEQLIYEFIFEALGYSKNKEQFIYLAQNLNIFKLKAILKRHDSKIALQSALFGFGGLTPEDENKNDYISELNYYFKDIKQIIKCGYLTISSWYFFRLRPVNFPTVRLAYGSQVIYNIIRNKMLINIKKAFAYKDTKDMYSEIISIFRPAPDKYWNKHYKFGNAAENNVKLIGRDRINEIIINVILPFMYLYSESFNKKNIRTKVYMLYNELRIESVNSVTQKVFDNFNIKYRFKNITPSISQGCIQLYNFYCTRKRCDDCLIGKKLYMKDGYNYRIIYY